MMAQLLCELPRHWANGKAHDFVGGLAGLNIFGFFRRRSGGQGLSAKK